mmetsp:Transcript_17620/g.48863  ORF Transcript_17620/g.48863 Transcript_17620/m.48863 type:complete len:104 (-) Transcript_17620:2032-2343(-)
MPPPEQTDAIKLLESDVLKTNFWNSVNQVLFISSNYILGFLLVFYDALESPFCFSVFLFFCFFSRRWQSNNFVFWFSTAIFRQIPGHPAFPSSVSSHGRGAVS